MIRYIKGELIETGPESAIIETGGLGYELIVPELTAEHLAARGPGAEVLLYTFHYLAIDHSRGTPMLLGFDSPAQRALFEKLLEVPRIGPRLACRLLAAPVANIARAIELGDVKFLRSLPGVGASKARDLTNSLQGKLAEFMTLEEDLTAELSETALEADAIEVLTQLGYTMADARRRILDALTRQPELASSVEELVTEALLERT